MTESSDLLTGGLVPSAGGITADSTDTLTNKTFDANGTGNSLSNVDVADLAAGTDGELITWDASGNPTTVAVGTSGQILTSNGAGAAPTFQDAAGGADSIPNSGYLTGRYYHSFAHTINATEAWAADILYAQPFLIAETQTFTGIAINVTSSGTATDARLGIYNTVAGQPTTLVLDCGTVAVGTTGIKEASISQSLDPGWYSLGVVFNGTVTTYRAGASSSGLVRHLFGSTNWLSDDVKSQTASHTYAALPASYPTITSDSANVPVITLSVS